MCSLSVKSSDIYKRRLYQIFSNQFQRKTPLCLLCPTMFPTMSTFGFTKNNCLTVFWQPYSVRFMFNCSTMSQNNSHDINFFTSLKIFINWKVLMDSFNKCSQPSIKSLQSHSHIEKTGLEKFSQSSLDWCAALNRKLCTPQLLFMAKGL